MSLIDRIRQPVTVDPDDLEEHARRRIQEIVRCYRHSWDLYAELLQNSVDAINRRFRILNDPNFYLYAKYRETEDLASDPKYTGKILVRVDLQTRTIQIADNGTGILNDHLDVFLLPGETDKSMGKEYGCKGYGLTFVGFVSRSMKIESTHFLNPGSCSHIEIEGLFGWLCEESDFPTGPTDSPTETDPIDGDWNTAITIGLDDAYKSKFPAIAALDEAINLAAKRDRIDYVLRSAIRTHVLHQRDGFPLQRLDPFHRFLQTLAIDVHQE